MYDYKIVILSSATDAISGAQRLNGFGALGYRVVSATLDAGGELVVIMEKNIYVPLDDTETVAAVEYDLKAASGAFASPASADDDGIWDLLKKIDAENEPAQEGLELTKAELNETLAI